MRDATLFKHLLQLAIPGRCLHIIVASHVLTCDETVRNCGLSSLVSKSRLELVTSAVIVQFDCEVLDRLALEERLGLITEGTVRFRENHHRIVAY